MWARKRKLWETQGVQISESGVEDCIRSHLEGVCVSIHGIFLLSVVVVGIFVLSAVVVVARVFELFLTLDVLL